MDKADCCCCFCRQESDCESLQSGDDLGKMSVQSARVQEKHKPYDFLQSYKNQSAKLHLHISCHSSLTTGHECPYVRDGIPYFNFGKVVWYTALQRRTNPREVHHSPTWGKNVLREGGIWQQSAVWQSELRLWCLVYTSLRPLTLLLWLELQQYQSGEGRMVKLAN